MINFINLCLNVTIMMGSYVSVLEVSVLKSSFVDMGVG